MSGDMEELVGTLTPEQRRRFLKAAERPLKVRRAVLLLAMHVTGHKKHPHGEHCEECREPWPCVTVRRAAGPALDAFADCDPLDVDTMNALIAAAEQRGREDNADHSMCYVHGSKALEARLAEERETALREWIAEWPCEPGDGTFLGSVARDGLERADRERA